MTYTVYLSGPDGDHTYETGATTLTVPAGDLSAVGEYRWAVVARDPYSARTSLDPFRFNNLTVASEPGVSPLRALTVEPNPVRETATVRFSLARPQTLTLEVIDALGRQVHHVALGRKAAGDHAVSVSFDGLGAGHYLLRLRGDDGVPTVRHVTRVR